MNPVSMSRITIEDKNFRFTMESTSRIKVATNSNGELSIETDMNDAAKPVQSPVALSDTNNEIGFKITSYQNYATIYQSANPEVAKLVETTLMNYVNEVGRDKLFQQFLRNDKNDSDSAIFVDSDSDDEVCSFYSKGSKAASTACKDLRILKASTFMELTEELFRSFKKKFSIYFIIRAFASAGYIISEKTVTGIQYCNDAYLNNTADLIQSSDQKLTGWFVFIKNLHVKGLNIRVNFWKSKVYREIHEDTLYLVKVSIDSTIPGSFLTIEYL